MYPAIIVFPSNIVTRFYFRFFSKLWYLHNEEEIYEYDNLYSGYIDYFFQSHLGAQFIANGFDFYALDLRKYGRSLLAHQHPNYCKDIAEYFEEITFAIRQIHESSNGDRFLLGHSTGGLIASNYMNDGQEKELIKGLILNSPFLATYPNFLRCLSTILTAALKSLITASL